jgi:hypothetical protein
MSAAPALLLLLLLGQANQSRVPTSSDVTFEYGTTAELKGIRKIFIETGGDLELRDQLSALIQKQLPNLLEVADRAPDADVVVSFEGGVEALDGIVKKRWANGAVFRAVDAHTRRLLLTFKRPPEIYRVGYSYTGDFVAAFVKAFRDANNLDKHNRAKQ